MHGQPRRFGAADKQPAQRPAERLAETYVHHEAAAEKARRAVPGMVVQLVGYDEVPRPDVFLETAYGAYREDPPDAQRLQREDVRPHIDFGRPDAVSPSVAGQERHAPAFERADHDGVARISERSGRTNLLDVRQALHPVEPRAADDRDLCFRHNTTLRLV